LKLSKKGENIARKNVRLCRSSSPREKMGKMMNDFDRKITEEFWGGSNFTRRYLKVEEMVFVQCIRKPSRSFASGL